MFGFRIRNSRDRRLLDVDISIYYLQYLLTEVTYFRWSMDGSSAYPRRSFAFVF